MRHAAALVLLAACGAPAAAPDAAVAVDATDAAGGCFLAGTHHLVGLTCDDGTSTIDLTAEVSGSTMSATGGAAGGESCDLAVTLAGTVCEETQTWHATPIAGDPAGRWQLATTGISSCAPDGCRFGAADDACAVGDHVGGGTVMFSVVLDVGTLVLSFADHDGECAQRGYAGEVQYWEP